MVENPQTSDGGQEESGPRSQPSGRQPDTAGGKEELTPAPEPVFSMGSALPFGLL
jgi:hypothetical protein